MANAYNSTRKTLILNPQVSMPMSMSITAKETKDIDFNIKNMI
ncbi:MAG: hypothetical protein AAFO15_01220 [Pseudomonadota bacterium]